VNGQRAWAVRVTVLATDADIDDVTDRLGLALCPDPDHSGGCPNPCEITTAAVDDLDEPDRSSWMATAEDLRRQELGASPGPICP
jgi:hypothetical protein